MRKSRAALGTALLLLGATACSGVRDDGVVIPSGTFTKVPWTPTSLTMPPVLHAQEIYEALANANLPVSNPRDAARQGCMCWSLVETDELAIIVPFDQARLTMWMRGEDCSGRCWTTSAYLIMYAPDTPADRRPSYQAALLKAPWPIGEWK